MMNDRLPRLKKSQFINIFAKSIEEENIDRILICTQISLMSEMKDYIEIIFRNTLNVPELNKDISGLKDFIYRGGALSFLDYEVGEEISDSSSD